MTAPAPTCDFRVGGVRCGQSPARELEGRGLLCDQHRAVVERDRRDRAALEELRRRNTGRS